MTLTPVSELRSMSDQRLTDTFKNFK